MIERDPELLLKAMQLAIQELSSGRDAIQALMKCFDLIREGMAASKAVLLFVQSENPLKLTALASAGLSADQERACVELRSVPGVSPSVIRQAIEKRRSVFIPNAAAAGSAGGTSSLTDGDPHSVICSPIIETYRGKVLGVVYLQNTGILHSFEDEDRIWLSGIAGMVGTGFGEFASSQA
jgi:GAF domain-containing protein